MMENTHSYYVKIQCPNCGLVQNGKVVSTTPFHTKVHTCIGCKYVIKKSEWNEVFTYATNSPICPYCAKEVGYYADYADSDGEIIACECGKNFKLAVEAVLEFTSTTDCELNDSVHDWEPSAWITSETTNFYHCSKCDCTKSIDCKGEENES